MNNFTKFVEFTNNFTEFLELTSKFYEVHRSCEQLYKVSRSEKKFCKVHKILKQLWEVHGDLQITFGKSVKPTKTLWSVWIGRLDLSAWKFFLYFFFTGSKIFLGKHKCFVNTFHVSWILFRNKLNHGHCIQVDKIFGTVKKWLLVTIDRWPFYAV